MVEFRREETKNSTLRLEQVIRELKSENEQLKLRVDDLTSRLEHVMKELEKSQTQ